MHRTLLISALALLAATAAAAPAEATFPGRNGPIAFREFGPDGVGGPLFRALPDATPVGVIDSRPGLFSDWRADGRRIAFDFFEPDGDEQISTAKPDGTDVRVITSGPGIHEVPSWSPDGRRIAFGYSPEADPSTPSFETRLWTMRADGSHARPLPMSRAGFDVEPKYSPDGRWIVFARLRPATDETDWQSAIMLLPAEGGRVRQLTPWGLEYPEHPTWSPDGRWIVFDTDEPANATPDGSIEAIRPDGGGRHVILAADERLSGFKPWFSPDGRSILFVCNNKGLQPEFPPDFNDDLCVMDADGSDVVRLTNTLEASENWPSWGPATPQARLRLSHLNRIPLDRGGRHVVAPPIPTPDVPRPRAPRGPSPGGCRHP
jgi:Tol biopolymer transport system component